MSNVCCLICGVRWDYHGTSCLPEQEKEQKPYTCPVCNGHKTVQKPPWIPGDQTEWIMSSMETYPCPACDATGIVWSG